MMWSGLTKDVQSHCKKCNESKKYGRLPARIADATPWEIICVDLVGPWSVRTPSGTKKIKAFTEIDPATGWFEIVFIPDKIAETVMDTFHNSWLTCYPRTH
jgi:hypothetical protein